MQSLPAGGRYVKEDLVQQCLSDPEKTEGMIDELDHMDGNVGAVSQAITEVCAPNLPLLTLLMSIDYRKTLQQQRDRISQDYLQFIGSKVVLAGYHAFV